MASAQGARKGRSYLGISSQITVNNVMMSSQSIDSWRNAINAARSSINPRRRQLIDLFEIIKIDGHLESVMDKRRSAIANKKVHWASKSGEPNEFIEDNILQAPWFYDLRGHAQDAKSFGFSLIELQLGKDGLISEVELLPRQNCFPEYGFYAFHTGTANPAPGLGIYYESDERHINTSLFVGGKKTYGKLMTVAQYIIYKRGGFGDWAQFAEIFGMPFRVGEYDPWDDETRRKLYEGLEKMGGAGFAVIPKGSELKFHDTNSTGKSEVFSLLVKECNAEISKAYLGGTMTTDDGSSRSQSEVHQDGQNEIYLSDIIEQEYLLNWKLKPKLLALGYPVDGGKFTYPETNKLPLDKLIEVVMKLASLVDIDEEYIYKTFGVERPRAGSLPVRIKSTVSEPEQEAEKDEPKEKKKTVRLKAAAVDGDAFLQLALTGNQQYDLIFERIARELHQGKIVKGNIDPELFTWTRSQLMQALTEGYGAELHQYDPGSPDWNMLVNLNKNVHVFSAFKTHDQLRRATDFLTDEAGSVRSFVDFRNDILKLHKEYNINYLQAEHTTAIASAQMASRWVEIERNAELLPMLTFRSTEGENVCPICSSCNGISLPVNHPFWNSRYPPLHWHCNCDVDQSDDATMSDVEGRSFPKLQPMFENNVGKSGVVFPETHSYFEQGKKQVNDFLKHHPSEAEKLEQSWKQYNDYSSKHYYKEGFDKKSGGYIVRHKKHRGKEAVDNLITARVLKGRGDRVELIPPPGSDAIRNGIYWEFKKIQSATNQTRAVAHHLYRGRNQSSNLLIRFDQPINHTKVASGLKEGIRKDNKSLIKHVEVMWTENGEIKHRSYSAIEISSLKIDEIVEKMKSE
jgi:phage gp29-like protein